MTPADESCEFTGLELRVILAICQAGLAKAFNEALRQENRSPLHLICVAFALAKELRW